MAKNNKDIVATAKKKRYLFLLQKLKAGTLTRTEINEVGALEGEVGIQKEKPSGPGIVHTQGEVAKAFGMRKRTIEYWVENGMPRGDDGTYNLLDIAAWRSAPKEDEKPEKDEGDEWQSKYREYKARIAELDLAEKRGKMIPKAEVDEANVAKVLAIKRALLALPKQVAPSLAGREAREIQAHLTTRIEEVIARFADGSPEKVPAQPKKAKPKKAKTKKRSKKKRRKA